MVLSGCTVPRVEALPGRLEEGQSFCGVVQLGEKKAMCHCASVDVFIAFFTKKDTFTKKLLFTHCEGYMGIFGPRKRSQGVPEVPHSQSGRVVIRKKKMLLRVRTVCSG
jgi:hypothetical protein